MPALLGFGLQEEASKTSENHGSDGKEPAATPVGSTSGGADEAARLAAENERLRQELESAKGTRKSARRTRTRGVLTVFLVIITSLCVLGSTIGVWTKRTLTDTNKYVALVAPLAHDPAVTNALAAELTTEVFSALNVQQRISDALGSIPKLPAAAQLLAGPLTAGAQNLVESQVQTFLHSAAFATLWTELNRQLHTKLMALLNGDYSQLPNVAINGGSVQLNLVSVVAAILQQLVQSGANSLGINVTIPSIPANLDASAAIASLGSAIGISLPADFGQVTIMSADQLSTYQKLFHQLKRALGLLLLVTVLLFAVTIAVAPNRRRVLIWLGAGIAIALFLGGVFLRHVRSQVIGSISTSGARAAAQDAFNEVLASMRRIGLLVLVLAVIGAIVAYLAGKPEWLVRSSAWARQITQPRPEGSELDVWTAAHADQVRVGSIAVAIVVLFLTGIDWLPVAIVAALLGLALWGVSVAQQRVSASQEEPPTS